MVLVCLPSDSLSQHLPSYLGFSYLGRGISLHGCSSKAQLLILTLDEGYHLMATPPDLEHGVAPLGLGQSLCVMDVSWVEEGSLGSLLPGKSFCNKAGMNKEYWSQPLMGRNHCLELKSGKRASPV